MLTVWMDFGLKNFDLIRLIDKTVSCLALSSLRFFTEVHQGTINAGVLLLILVHKHLVRILAK